MDDLTKRFEKSLTLPSRGGSEEVLSEEDISAVFEKWKKKKVAYTLRVLKESLVASKLVDTKLGADIYEAALDYYAENDEWAEFHATAKSSGHKAEALLIASVLNPSDITYDGSIDISLFFLISRNYSKIRRCSLPTRVEKFVKSQVENWKVDFVNKKIIR